MDAKINTLTVEAFRSIGKSLTFDLQSPLTLIYAPNGTGKTTVCEAAEWMLTGQIERLSSPAGFDLSILTSKFLSPHQPSEVRASFSLSGGVGFLSRKSTGLQETLEVGKSSSSSSEMAHKDWLGLLSSGFEEGFSGFSASEQTIRRWVRGSRFLTVDDLASIMDADESNSEKKIQVLSDLLGVRHLFDAGKTFEVYLGELAEQLEGIRSELKALKSERNSLKDLEKNLVENPVIYWAGFDRQIGVIEEKIYGIVTQSTNSSSRIEELGSVISGQDQENSNKLAIAKKIDGYLIGRTSELYAAQDLKIKQDTLSKKIKTSHDSIAKREDHIAGLQSQITFCDERLKLFPGMRSVVESTIKDFVTAFEEHSETLKISKSFGLKKLRNLLSKKSISADDDNDSSYLKILNIVSRELPRIKDEIKRINVERKKLIAKLSDADADEASYKSNLKVCEDVLHIQTNELKAIEQPLLTLQSNVREYLSTQHRHYASDCPVCGYGHGSPDELSSAMDRVLATLPDLIESKRDSCLRISTERDYWKGKLEVLGELRLKLQALDLDLAKATNHEKSLISGLSLYGITSRDPKISMGREISREVLATKFFELHSSITALEQAFPDFLKISSLTVEELSITTKFSDYQCKQEELAKGLRNAVVQEKHHLNGLRSQVEIDSFNLHEVRIKLARATRKLNDIDELWKSLAGEEAWSHDNFKKTHTRLLGKERELALLRRSLDQLGRQFSSSEALHRRDELDAKTSELTEKLFTAESRHKITIRAKNDFKFEYDKTTKERLENLASSVTPLFMRMHSNRIYDSIGFKDGDQGGLLKVTSTGDVFSTYTDFSQGQRQDLALAIFLARARAVGGTFFLDEPVMYLDDLNRVALLDILRAFALENGNRINLVVTTSSKVLARHMIQKFSSVGKVELPEGMVSPLTVYALEGNALTGVASKKIYG